MMNNVCSVLFKKSLRTSSSITSFSVLVFLSMPSLSAQSLITQWKGLTIAWRDSINWDKGVPDTSKKVLISLGTPDYSNPFVPAPLGTDTASTGVLTIQSGSNLCFNTDGVLIIYGNEKTQNDGNISLGSGRIILRNNIGFLNGGTFDAGDGVVDFSGGTWMNKTGATFLAGTSTVIFDGSGSQAFDADTPFSFYNLDLLTQGNATITGNVTVLNSCYVAAGCTLNVPLGSTFTVNGAFVCDGVVMGFGTFTSPLPVQMSFFSVAANGLSSVLRWRTETETDNYGFEVQRRSFGAPAYPGEETEVQSRFNIHDSPQWTVAGFVRGSGTSSSPHEYSFTDLNLPPGRYAFRIRQIDHSGAFFYSGAVEIEVGLAPRELTLDQNYPNPFNPSTSIRFTIPQDGRVRLKVFDVAGRELATLFDGEAAGGHVLTATFDASGLATGLYFAQLEYGGKSLLRKMLLVK